MIYAKDIALCLAKDFGLTLTKSEKIVKEVFDVISAELECGGEVKLKNFGSFRVTEKNPRLGRNVRTGENVPIPNRYVPVFKPSKELMKAVAFIKQRQR